jgi:cation diffusion facilitator CzcD-associated flavoprotein CzcO
VIGIFAVREPVETIVIGGGQTGLAISNHDVQRGVAD